MFVPIERGQIAASSGLPLVWAARNDSSLARISTIRLATPVNSAKSPPILGLNVRGMDDLAAK